ncbi:MAG: FAD-dependent oxidoreductase, partial [Treponema sp.]|nr:FAD-dependent oxidoreductase [Treponema sp.]
MKKVIIVGGVAGGASAAARLRRLDESARIIMIERGEYISFANCGLPYYIGGEIKSNSALTLQTPESFTARFNAEVRIKNEVTAIDRQAKTVLVTNLNSGEKYSETYDFLILSPGAEPVLPNIPGIDSSRVFTLRNIPDTYKIKDFIENNHPQSAVVVGGGYIGIEMAENLKNAGLSVTIVELLDQVITPLDYDMACDVHRHIEQKGVYLLLGNAVQKIEESSNGLSVTLSQSSLNTDMVIMSAGVRPESGIAKNSGLAINERGGIIVNENMRTSDDSIYAVGDAVEIIDFVTRQKAMIPLAGPANKQGRIAADNICGISTKYGGTQGSAILKVFDMTVATTGINEKTAKKLGLDYEKSFTWSANHAGYYPRAVNMSVKTLFEKGSGKILGAQISGFDGVDKRCDIFAVAIRTGMTALDLAALELCYAPPYSSAKDPVNMAGFVIENMLTGKVKNFHWHDVDELPRNGTVTLLDTRTELEYENGHID